MITKQKKNNKPTERYFGPGILQKMFTYPQEKNLVQR